MQQKRQVQNEPIQVTHQFHRLIRHRRCPRPPLWFGHILTRTRKKLGHVIIVQLCTLLSESHVQLNTHTPRTTRYLSIACTSARGSILTGPPFHCFTLVQSGCLCSWHFSWCVLKNFSAWEPLETHTHTSNSIKQQSRIYSWLYPEYMHTYHTH